MIPTAAIDTIVANALACKADASRLWYALRTSDNRLLKAVDVLMQHGICTYVALRHKWTKNDEEQSPLENLIPYVFFAYLTQQEFTDIFCTPQKSQSTLGRELNFVSYITTDSYNRREHVRQPQTFNFDAIQNLILATYTHNKNIFLLDAGRYRVMSDRDMMVKEGPYKGVHGRLIRAFRQQRLLVQLMPLARIGTPYIPTDCICEINDMQ